MQLRPYLRVLLRGWHLIASMVIAALALSALLTLLIPAVYEGKVQIFVSTTGGKDGNSRAAGTAFVQDQVETYADVVSTPLVLQPVIDDLAIDESPADLGQRVHASIPPGTSLINLSVSHSDPFAAATWANSIAQQFTVAVEDLAQVDEFSASPIRATVVRNAVPSDLPSNPRPVRTMALGSLLGLLLGMGLAVHRDRVGTRITTEEQLRRLSDAPVLGTNAYHQQAREDELVARDDPRSPLVEEYRTLRTNLKFLGTADPPRSIVVTSSQPDEGKTTTVANLALVMAATGSKVCLVEGDLRHPRLLDLLGMDETLGLTDVLVGRVGVDDVLQSLGESVRILGAGTLPPNPSELLGSESMRSLLRRLEDQFDYVLVDSPALLSVTDAALLSRQTDGAIVVVWGGVVRREELRRSLSALRIAGADLLGFVLNRTPNSSTNTHGYYNHEYKSDIATIPG